MNSASLILSKEEIYISERVKHMTEIVYEVEQINFQIISILNHDFLVKLHNCELTTINAVEHSGMHFLCNSKANFKDIECKIDVLVDVWSL